MDEIDGYKAIARYALGRRPRRESFPTQITEEKRKADYFEVISLMGFRLYHPFAKQPDVGFSSTK